MTRAPIRSVAHIAIAWWVMLACGALAVETPRPNPTPDRIPKIDGGIAVDGSLDEEAWSTAWTADLPYEVHPGENTPAPVRTEVLLAYDSAHLYVGFRAYDPDPRAIRAHFSDRDEAWSDDWVGVVLDTFNDERRNYLLIVNPLGVQMDNIETGIGMPTVWDGIWKSAARITDWGWSAELKIPFSTLRFQRSSGPQVWGFDAIRRYPRTISRQMGAFPRDRDNNCYLCQAIKIEGFEGVSPGRNLEIAPTLTGARTDEREDLPDDPMIQGDVETQAGVTVRWGFTPNLTLSGTINPDFSQVEADAAQLDINEPFALFFPEKRPFFMEAADFFATPFNAVYTRMMRDPAWGVKVSGKEGAHTVGSYVVRDDVTNIIFPGSESSDSESFDWQNTAVVGRYRYDIGNRYTLGALVTDREGEDYFNRVAGLDGDFRLSATDRVTVQLLGASTAYPDDIADEYGQPSGTFSDFAGELFYLHESRTWGWWGLLQDIGADFRADLGFMPRVDIRYGEVGGSRAWIPTENSWHAGLDLVGKVSYGQDHEGNLLENELALMFVYQGPLQSHSVVRPSRMREGYDGEEFDMHRLFVHTCIQPNRHSQVWLNLTIGGQVDYANTRPGDATRVDGGFSYRLGRHLYLDLRNTHENMYVSAGWLYKANIAQVEAAWQFNARAFVRAIIQEVRYDYNAALYVDEQDPEERHLFNQLLFSYKLNPQTVIFVGYSDNSYADHETTLTQADRTIFVKLGYAWVL